MRERFDFETAWQLHRTFVSVIAIGWAILLPYGLFSGVMEWSPWLLLAIAGVCFFVLAFAHFVVRRAEFDGHHLTITTLTGQRSIPIEDLWNASAPWFQRAEGDWGNASVRYRRGILLFPAAGDGHRLVRRLNEAHFRS